MEAGQVHEGISAPIAQGQLELRFDADRFRAAFTPATDAIQAAIDNALGIATIRIAANSSGQPTSDLGQLRLTPIGAATGPTVLQATPQELRGADGSPILVNPIAPATITVER